MIRVKSVAQAAAFSLGLAMAGPGMDAAAAETFSFSPPEPEGASASMAALADAVIAAYHDDNRAQYLDTLFRLQMVAGHDAAAAQTLADLRRLRAADPSPGVAAKDVQYEILLTAKALQAEDHFSFEAAFARAFRARLSTLDDRTSALVIRAMSPYSTGISLHARTEEALKTALEQQKGKTRIDLATALSLLRADQVAEAFRTFTPLIGPLAEEDDRRRYVIEQTAVPTGDGASVCATIVRQRSATAPQPSLLEFTIYADPPTLLSEGRRTASNGARAAARAKPSLTSTTGPTPPS